MGKGKGRNQAPLTTKMNGRRGCRLDFGRGWDSVCSWRVGAEAARLRVRSGGSARTAGTRFRVGLHGGRGSGPAASQGLGTPGGWSIGLPGGARGGDRAGMRRARLRRERESMGENREGGRERRGRGKHRAAVAGNRQARVH
jgi:hypothetical protein